MKLLFYGNRWVSGIDQRFPGWPTNPSSAVLVMSGQGCFCLHRAWQADSGWIRRELWRNFRDCCPDSTGS